MEVASLILAAISTVAAVVSAVAAIQAKNEVQKLTNNLSGDRNVQLSGKLNIKNKGNNQGVISGVNTGDIQN